MSLEVKIKKKLKEFTLESELNVETGCTGLMGPSGSGKSITLKCIAGVQTADSGRIILDGRVLYDSEKKIKKKIIPYTTIINRSDTITHQIAKLM